MLPNYFFFSFLMQTIAINAFEKKTIYNAIYLVHFLITSILHKLDIRVPLGVPKSSRLENSKRRENPGGALVKILIGMLVSFFWI